MLVQRRWFLAVAVVGSLLSRGSADACFTRASRDLNDASRDLNDVKYADVVLIGRVRNYKIVRDEEFRKRMLANPKFSSDLRAYYEGHNTVISDYGQLEIEVSEVLAGKTPTRVSVTWSNSTFGNPEAMASGPYLMALCKARSKVPPLRGPSATVLPDPEPESLIVLQAPCAAPFIFDPTSDGARIVRAILAGQPYTGSAVDGGSGRF